MLENWDYIRLGEDVDKKTPTKVVEAEILIYATRL
jgi:hypothetical protein